MALLRAPHWRRCLGAAAQQPQHLSGSALAARASGDSKDPFQNIQDPSQTRQAYSAEPGGRQVPSNEDEGVEREVKWGKNIPASAEQAKEEVQYAGKGLAESVEMAANVLLSKGKDAVAAAQRAMGMQSDRRQMGEGSMGAAGKMEHAPPGSSTGFASGQFVDAEAARAKYDEISATEKPNFPDGEKSVNEMFPEMKVAAEEQSNTPDQQKEENVRLRRELQASGGGAAGEHEPGETLSGMSDNIKDTLQDALHNRGP